MRATLQNCQANVPNRNTPKPGYSVTHGIALGLPQELILFINKLYRLDLSLILT